MNRLTIYRLALSAIVIAVVVLAIIGAGLALWLKSDGTKLHIANQTYYLDVASTDAEREKGLGDRSSMPADHGMLFTYKSPTYLCFWMKDMRFSLDIIWLNADKKIVKVEQNLSPKTYPEDYCADNAQYVIELNAGQAAAAHMQVGQKLDF